MTKQKRWFKHKHSEIDDTNIHGAVNVTVKKSLFTNIAYKIWIK